MNIGKRIKAVRLSEELSQSQFCQLVDMSIVSLRNYELEKRTVNEINLTKITGHARFDAYAYWLVTGKTLPESGQVCPAFSIQEQCGIISEEKNSKRA